ncbi:hypothetical protein FQR65_LT10927 [Abscondita terminalis]|nr:hypothetical protein FQR65_LT10927 [Abscondita terminalis]
MHPRSIVVHPKKGIMYWADWSHMSPGNGSIQRAWMNGQNQEIFLQQNVDWPTGLTLDFVGKKLYWCDAHLRRIESVDFDGENSCSGINGNCSELCLNTPTDAVCACSDGNKLMKDGKNLH